MLEFIVSKDDPQGYKRWTFPAGETGIELTQWATDENRIHAHIGTAEGLFEVALLANAIRNKAPESKLYLYIPYVPYGRQDRHTTDTSPFSLKVIADFINSLGFTKVYTDTPHSVATTLLINNCVTREPMLRPIPRGSCDGILTRSVIIAPDAGAEKRCYLYANRWGISEVVVCTKQRNPQDGTIIGVKCPAIENAEDKHLIVVDDICDGGTTFIELAKVLPKERKSLTLCVTHGIFSKGRQILLDAGYTHVYSRYNFLERNNE